MWPGQDLCPFAVGVKDAAGARALSAELALPQSIAFLSRGQVGGSNRGKKVEGASQKRTYEEVQAAMPAKVEAAPRTAARKAARKAARNPSVAARDLPAEAETAARRAAERAAQNPSVAAAGAETAARTRQVEQAVAAAGAETAARKRQVEPAVEALPLHLTSALNSQMAGATSAVVSVLPSIAASRTCTNCKQKGHRKDKCPNMQRAALPRPSPSAALALASPPPAGGAGASGGFAGAL